MTEGEKPLYDSSKMEYRYLGNSGLRVSVLGFGVMMHKDVKNKKEILKICLENEISIKIFKNGFGPNDGGEGRKHIIEGVKKSLKNMELDYADIVFAHRYDRNTPIEETVRAMNYLIEKGLCFYWLLLNGLLIKLKELLIFVKKEI